MPGTKKVEHELGKIFADEGLPDVQGLPSAANKGWNKPSPSPTNKWVDLPCRWYTPQTAGNDDCDTLETWTGPMPSRDARAAARAPSGVVIVDEKPAGKEADHFIPVSRM